MRKLRLPHHPGRSRGRGRRSRRRICRPAGRVGKGHGRADGVPDSSLHPRSTTVGGASVLPTTRTIPHWFGQTKDPNERRHLRLQHGRRRPEQVLRLGMRRARSRPTSRRSTSSSAAMTFRRHRRRCRPTLASPQFATTTTARPRPRRLPALPATHRRSSAARAAPCHRATPAIRCSSRTRRCGRSSTRRAPAPTTCASHPTCCRPVTINVPSNQGILLQSGRGVHLRRRRHRLVVLADQQPRDEAPTRRICRST